MRAVVMAVLLVALVGCGWRLAGTDLAGNLDSIYVDANRTVGLTGQLERALGFSGVEISDDESQATAVIELLEQRESQRTLTVTRTARTAEYELVLQVRYRVRGKDDAMLIDENWVSQTRVYRLNRANLVGSSSQRDLLIDEMETALVQQIIRRLDVATTKVAA